MTTEEDHLSQIPEHILNEQDTIKVASDEDLKRAQKLAKEFVEIGLNMEELEKQLKVLKERKSQIESREIPDLFGEIGVDVIGLPDDNCDVIVRPYYKANIPASWDPDRREQAFRWLDENGHGDVISVTVSVDFQRGEKALADELVNLIRTKFSGANSHQVKTVMGVPWTTLTALVKEQVEQGEAIPLDTLGATVGQVAKITKRKK